VANFLQVNEGIGAIYYVIWKAQVPRFEAGVLGKSMVHCSIHVDPRLVWTIWANANEDIGGIFCQSMK